MPRTHYTHTHEMEITLMGLVIPVSAEYRVTSYGSPDSGPSWSSPGEPGDPAEIELGRIAAQDTGYDLTAACNRPDGVRITMYYELGPSGTMQAAVLNPIYRNSAVSMSRFEYHTKFGNAASSIAEEIEAAILEEAAFMDDCNFEPEWD